MATKAELAESLTVDQLRTLATDKGIDLTGKTNKAEIAEAVAAGASKSDLEQAQPDASPETTTTTEEAPVQPPSPETTATAQATEAAADEQPVRTATPVGSISPNDTEALAKAGLSAADLELATPTLPGGESRIVKASPETPTTRQVEASEVEQVGPPAAAIQLVTPEGQDNIEGVVMADDAAQISQRVFATTASSPVQQAAGHGSNPNLREMTDEEKEENERAYAARIS